MPSDITKNKLIIKTKLQKIFAYFKHLAVKLSAWILHDLIMNYALLWTDSQGVVNINKFLICLIMLAGKLPKNDYNVNHSFWG